MMRKSLPFWLGTLVLPLVSITANAVPSQLYNKSIEVSWSEGRRQKFPNGTERYRVVYAAFTIYVSSAGRMFIQSGRQVVNKRRKTTHLGGRSVSPDGDVIKTSNMRYRGNLHFEGNSLVSTVQFESGARRIVVSFDSGFSSCTLGITHGKEQGAPGIVQHGLSGRLFMLMSVDISSQSCAVRQGNVLAEE
jgi:hypothetical protein